VRALRRFHCSRGAFGACFSPASRWGLKIRMNITPDPVLRRNGFDRLVRLAIGLEDQADLRACLEWALRD